MDVLVARLKWLREKHRYSQRDISENINMTLNGYQKIEYGDREPKIDVLIKLCDIFNVSADFLLGRTDNTDKLLKLSKQYYDFQTQMVNYQKRINETHHQIASLQQEKMETQLFAGTDINMKIAQTEQKLKMYQDQLNYLQYNFHDNQVTRNNVLRDYIIELYNIPCSTPEKDNIVKSYLPLDVVVAEKLDNAYTLRLKSLNGTDIGIIGMARNTDNLEENFSKTLEQYRKLLRLE